ncbi:MAG TPA: aminotransferase class I/II-fold pyridoxal phosphate-dependent enzyme [Gaiellales bacterium]
MTEPRTLADRVRPDLVLGSGYRWQAGLPDGPLDRFDMNTPPDAPAWYLPAIARLAALPANDYPDASYRPLKQAIARLVGVQADQVAVGAGCDEIILLVAALGLGPGRVALVHRPTYQLYAVAARNVGADVVAVAPRTGIEPDWGAFLAAAPSAHVAFICSPNNPTGHEASAELVRAVCAACRGIVFVDQAYLELGGIDHLPLVAELDHLIVGRTFSKGYGLGAARVGYALAQPPLAGALDSLRPPGSLSSWSAAVGELATTQETEMRERVARTLAERDRLARGVREAGVVVDAVAGNYLLARLPTPDAFERLAERRLVVRTFAHEPLLAGHFRATVAAPDANDRLIAALAELAGGEPASTSPAPDGRVGEVHRATRETRIDCRLALDGSGRARIATGLGFLDHMLTALTFWWMVDLDLRCAGDLWIDEHHTMEDCAIAIGEALDSALGDRAGLTRFADARAPLDEALAEATVDLSGRGIARIELGLTDERIGQVPSSLFPHVLDTLARRGRIGLHVRGEGDDDHHVVEAAFKAIAIALRTACAPDPARAGISSTKGLL